MVCISRENTPFQIACFLFSLFFLDISYEFIFNVTWKRYGKIGFAIYFTRVVETRRIILECYTVFYTWRIKSKFKVVCTRCSTLIRWLCYTDELIKLPNFKSQARSISRWTSRRSSNRADIEEDEKRNNRGKNTLPLSRFRKARNPGAFSNLFFNLELIKSLIKRIDTENEKCLRTFFPRV